MKRAEIMQPKFLDSPSLTELPELLSPVSSPVMLPLSSKLLVPFPEYIDPLEMGYYYGLPDSPQLLARNSNTVTLPDTYLDSGGIYRIQGKCAFEIGNCHPINAYLKRGLEKRIKNGIRCMIKEEFLMVEIKRVGFNEEPSKNPVVILITVRKETARIDAEWVMEEIEKMIKHHRLRGVEVEVKEGNATTLPLEALPFRPPPEPLPFTLPSIPDFSIAEPTQRTGRISPRRTRICVGE